MVDFEDARFWFGKGCLWTSGLYSAHLRKGAMFKPTHIKHNTIFPICQKCLHIFCDFSIENFFKKLNIWSLSSEDG